MCCYIGFNILILSYFDKLDKKAFNINQFFIVSLYEYTQLHTNFCLC